MLQRPMPGPQSAEFTLVHYHHPLGAYRMVSVVEHRWVTRHPQGVHVAASQVSDVPLVAVAASLPTAVVPASVMKPPKKLRRTIGTLVSPRPPITSRARLHSASRMKRPTTSKSVFWPRLQGRFLPFS